MLGAMSVQDPGAAGDRAPKPGQQPKGRRRAITTRVPEPHWDVFQEAAEQAGLPLGEYVYSVMAREHHLPEPDYLIRHRKRVAERRKNPNQLDVLDAISA
jgi:hypothetical protein